MAVRFEIRHPQSETAFLPQKTQNFASVIELKIAILGGIPTLNDAPPLFLLEYNSTRSKKSVCDAVFILRHIATS